MNKTAIIIGALAVAILIGYFIISLSSENASGGASVGAAAVASGSDTGSAGNTSDAGSAGNTSDAGSAGNTSDTGSAGSIGSTSAGNNNEILVENAATYINYPYNRIKASAPIPNCGPISGTSKWENICIVADKAQAKSLCEANKATCGGYVEDTGQNNPVYYLTAAKTPEESDRYPVLTNTPNIGWSPSNILLPTAAASGSGEAKGCGDNGGARCRYTIDINEAINWCNGASCTKIIKEKIPNASNTIVYYVPTITNYPTKSRYRYVRIN